MNTVKIKRVFLIIFTLAAVIILGIGNYFLHMTSATLANINDDVDWEQSDKRPAAVDLKAGDPISVLLMGVDDGGGRTDSLILLTVNPRVESINMISIPRDTLTNIAGKGEKDKINHAYSFGGSETTIRTVENLLDVPVDYVLKVNMESFTNVVDALGGVEVENDLDFTFRDHHYPEGTLQLNGEEALGYARMRHKDPRGDFGRQERQQQVLEAVIEKGASLSSITKIDDVFEIVEKNVKTNIQFSEVWDMQSNYKNARHHIKQLAIEGKETEIDKTYYFKPNEDKLTSISQELQEHLNLSKVKEDEN
ncbi:LCP family protein [Alteribacillus sp. JSM 102045]|uniref:LCP family glycopolymer transferase n=1 Tax=Alteribacillus sp. JSM 102045 TaxID=1562101 RepID=UPI0035BEB77F